MGIWTKRLEEQSELYLNSAMKDKTIDRIRKNVHHEGYEEHNGQQNEEKLSFIEDMKDKTPLETGDNVLHPLVMYLFYDNINLINWNRKVLSGLILTDIH